MSVTTITENTCFGGVQGVYAHMSDQLGCEMRFSVFKPAESVSEPRPVVFWLSGLTCTEENFTVKAGAQRYAAEHGLVVVAPDTSPRGDDVPDDEAFDFGKGAGFYLNATEAPWSTHFHMYDYITGELPALIFKNFPARADAQGIMGHSMGGHGALTIGLKNPDTYTSISAFSPIVAPMQVPWGQKAFSGYLGDNPDDWKQYDATELVKSGARSGTQILIDQGEADDFLNEQLKPHLFEAACKDAGQAVQIRIQPAYDHSYYFIASFMGDHMAHHAAALLA
ncbi:MAG: S-formylglutathione hydrolase [Rhodospirillales bacterium]|nr:S-formylglutathione hydrolase [Rhodospirillales bacterium]MBT4039848.1 S-formylglutathione hydrolase [Rhodospirillales bacterium]MBT4627480.1 S-formylglutathione hydrolase [Rhodospirillales bacterium]MBT5350980.1 S-formylglutathione hydrolase [Rhodospirillales bacterium]MBT5520600.1 S-formylglutathione hydrolase [Rhodospirillales bacterium]